MGKLLLKALKILLVLILLGLTAVGLYLLVTWRGWPWWTAAAIFIGLLGLILGGLFLKKYLLRRREKKFVQRIVEQDESLLAKKPIIERQALRDLESRFKEATNILRRSRLRKFGHPLYVLPWYLMLGESGSGKTTAIKSARLHSPVTEISPGIAGAGTKNCDWWFFENAVILDTAGRYVHSTDELADKEEWQKFLGLLAKGRRREPLNGVILTVSAEKLLSASMDALAEEAQALRRRVDELMRLLGARFPVYILVTKMDKIAGFTEYSRLLPNFIQDQVMGWTNTSLGHDPARMGNLAIDEITDRLKDLRVFILDRDQTHDPGPLIFPDEMAGLKPKLQHFLVTAFEENSFQETPLLRGIYFCSGRQKGTIKPQTLADGAFKDLSQELPGTEDGLFLADLFARVLPADRDLITPLKEYVRWRRLTRSMGLGAWVAVSICVAGALTLSYLKNYETLKSFAKDPHALSLSGDMLKDILLMKLFRDELMKVEGANQNWWLPRLGLTQSLGAELYFKDRYCQIFTAGFLDGLDQSMQQKIGAFTSQTQGETIGWFVAHLVTRINLLNGHLQGKSGSDLEKMPKPAYKALVVIDEKLLPEIAANFSDLYLSYILWNEDHANLDTELLKLRANLKHIGDIRGMAWHWIVDWANVQTYNKTVTLKEFWGNYSLSPNSELVEVPRAFTRQGRETIDLLIKNYETAVENPATLQENKKDFNEFYWRQYLDAWTNFGQNFDQGFIRLTNEDDRRSLARIMANPDNPYFALLDKMAAELKPLYDRPQSPDWVRGVVDFERVKTALIQSQAQKSSTGLAKIAKEGEIIIKKTATEIKDMASLQAQVDIEKAADKLDAYQKALGQMIPMTSSREMAFKLAKSFYPLGEVQTADVPGKEAHPLQLANTALVQLNSLLLKMGAQSPDNLCWRIMSGPMAFLLAYMTHEAACELQAQWEGNVLAQVKDMPPEKLRAALFDKDQGYVWKFTNNTASDFLGRDRNGYFSRTCLDQPFPFQTSFLAFLDQGAARSQMILPEYQVVVKSKPTNVNRGTTLEPFAVTLTLECAAGAQRLDNYNYPTEQTFKFKPDQCGDVTLEIKFYDFTLLKTYKGIQGFPEFLEDFRDGARSFTPDDFPSRSEELKKIGVSRIRVSYGITGSEPVRKLLKKDEFQLPKVIVECQGS